MLARVAAAFLALFAVPSSVAQPVEPVLADAPPAVTEIRIDGDVDDLAVLAVEAGVAGAAGAPIRVVINSPGGSVFAGMRIIRMLRSAPGPVTCEVEDLAASMAAAIFESQGCDVRIVEPSSVLMFHEAALGLFGGVREGDADAARGALHAINRALAAIIAPRLGLTLDEYLARTTGGREWWIAGVDALAEKAADTIQ